jgi:hypothetical protein
MQLVTPNTRNYCSNGVAEFAVHQADNVPTSGMAQERYGPSDAPLCMLQLLGMPM